MVFVGTVVRECSLVVFVDSMVYGGSPRACVAWAVSDIAMVYGVVPVDVLFPGMVPSLIVR